MPERSHPEIEVQPIALDEVDAAVETITLAFQTDPVWRVALESPDGATDHLRPYWRFYIEGARRYDSVWASPGAGTVSVWIPPGGTEVSEEQEAAIHELAQSALGSDRAGALFDLWDRFEETIHDHSRTATSACWRPIRIMPGAATARLTSPPTSRAGITSGSRRTWSRPIPETTIDTPDGVTNRSAALMRRWTAQRSRRCGGPPEGDISVQRSPRARSPHAALGMT